MSAVIETCIMPTDDAIVKRSFTSHCQFYDISCHSLR